MTEARRSILRRDVLRAGTSLLAAGACGSAAAQTAATQPAATPAAMTARANFGTVGIVAGGVDGTYIRIAADLAAVLDDGDRLRVLPIIGRGSVQNIADILFLRGVDVGIVQSDALAFVRRRRLFPGVDQAVQYVAKLYDEELHLLAGPGVARLEDLAGRRVNVDVQGSGTAMTCSLVFEALGLGVNATNHPQDVALRMLRDGEIAALAYVAGKPARLFSSIPAGSGLRFLPVPLTDALVETYLPSRLGHEQYPALIPADAPAVETLGVGAVMAVYAWAPGTERHRKVAAFVQALHARFDAFLQPPRHPKWREVNLAAGVPGWVRFNPASDPSVRGR